MLFARFCVTSGYICIPSSHNWLTRNRKNSWMKSLLLFPISRSLSTSRRRTDELGYRLERPIHFECKLNEPMHIGMRLLHPAAADHSVSISRQQVQRIFSFSLRSRAVTSFCSWHLLTSEFNKLSTLFGRLSCWWTALQRWWLFPCWVDCTHQAALPPVCVADDNLPCALQHAKIVFFPKRAFTGASF